MGTPGDAADQDLKRRRAQLDQEFEAIRRSMVAEGALQEERLEVVESDPRPGIPPDEGYQERAEAASRIDAQTMGELRARYQALKQELHEIDDRLRTLDHHD